MKAPDTYSL